MGRKRTSTHGPNAGAVRVCPPEWWRPPTINVTLCVHCSVLIGPCDDCGEAALACPCCAGPVVLL